MRIKRRSFVKFTALMGGTALLNSSLMSRVLGSIPNIHNPDIITTSADDPLPAVEKLVNALGGIEKFIVPGQSVGFLLNSPWKTAGNYTHPDVALAAVKLFKNAGAGKIVVYKPVPANYWERSRYYETNKKLVEAITYGDERVEVAIPEGKKLKKAEVFQEFINTDVFVNIPVAKHHNGTIFSGMLKGLMGVSSSETNRQMHSPDGKYTYSKPVYLAACIADLALLRKPDLCIFDAIECSLDNGPRGPSSTVKPNKLLAGTDPLLLDVYAADLIGFYPDDILTFRKALENNIGKTDIKNAKILNV
ncbi:MAG: DUF362 domain-containing protein [Bacteroidota bacterium]|nr:DUF362 domain-containing protein [Bacteroidota bacterium]